MGENEHFPSDLGTAWMWYHRDWKSNPFRVIRTIEWGPYMFKEESLPMDIGTGKYLSYYMFEGSIYDVIDDIINSDLAFS